MNFKDEAKVKTGGWLSSAGILLGLAQLNVHCFVGAILVVALQHYHTVNPPNEEVGLVPAH